MKSAYCTHLLECLEQCSYCTYLFIAVSKNYYFIANADGFETAVETIEAEDAETPVYFNLQGMKVEKPENGVFIKVTGGKSEKVLF